MLTEIHGDLFAAPEDYALAHCISADFALGAGIAKEFQRRYGVRDTLRRSYQNGEYEWHQGKHGFCLPIYTADGRAILNLVTKERYWHKPTLDTLSAALLDMKQYCLAYNIRRIAMPRIGCGLDKLNWNDVRALLQKTFGNSGIDIVVYG